MLLFVTCCPVRDYFKVSGKVNVGHDTSMEACCRLTIPTCALCGSIAANVFALYALSGNQLVQMISPGLLRSLDIVDDTVKSLPEQLHLL